MELLETVKPQDIVVVIKPMNNIIKNIIGTILIVGGGMILGSFILVGKVWIERNVECPYMEKLQTLNAQRELIEDGHTTHINYTRLYGNVRPRIIIIN